MTESGTEESRLNEMKIFFSRILRVIFSHSDNKLLSLTAGDVKRVMIVKLELTSSVFVRGYA